MKAHPTLTGDDLRRAIRDAARCRGSRNHRLELIPGDPSRRPMFGTLVTWRCELCGTIRYDTVQRMTGELLARSYDHPDWYLAANEDGAEPSWWRAKYWESLDDSYFIDAAPLTRPTPIKRARKRAS